MIFSKFFQSVAMATRVVQGFQFFLATLERTTKGTLLPINNEIQAILSDKKIFKDFTIDI